MVQVGSHFSFSLVGTCAISMCSTSGIASVLLNTNPWVRIHISRGTGHTGSTFHVVKFILVYVDDHSDGITIVIIFNKVN